MEVLMYVWYIVINFRGRHGSWRLVHYHRVVGVTTTAEWVGLGSAFGNPSMEAILSCKVTSTLNSIWQTMSKLKKVGAAASWELSTKDGNLYNEIVSTGVFLPQNNSLCSIEGPSMFTRSRWKRRDMCAKELVKSYN